MDTIEIDTSQELPRSRLIALLKASLLAITADFCLIILKTILAKLTGSAVLLADAWHSGGDLAVSFTVMLSIIANYRFKSSPWAKNAEGLVALLIAIVLLIGSISLIFNVFTNDVANYKLKPGIPLVIAILGIGISCAVAFGMFRFKRKIGKEHQSFAFIAESHHTHSDYFTSLGVFFTLILGYFGIHLERFTTFIVGLIVFRIGIKLLFRAFRYFNLKLKPTGIKAEQLIPLKNRERVVEVVGLFLVALKNCYKKLKSRLLLRDEWILENRKILTVLFFTLIIALYLGTGFYAVEPYQSGIDLQFGKVVRLTGPGAHYCLPRPFGERIMVDTGVIARVESGYRTVYNFTEDEPPAYLWEYTHNLGRYIKVLDEALAITGDENLIDLNVLCYFKITDPVTYALENENSYETLRSLLVHDVHNLLGACRLDSLLTDGRGKIQETLFLNLQEKSQALNLGVEIIGIYLQEAHPPLEVVPEYRSVASAREKKNEIVHQATAYKNDLLPRKRGEAVALKFDAQAYVIEKTSLAEGEARAFLLKQRDFSRFRSVQQARLRWETAEGALKNKVLFIIPSASHKRIFLSKTKPGESRDE